MIRSSLQLSDVNDMLPVAMMLYLIHFHVSVCSVEKKCNNVSPSGDDDRKFVSLFCLFMFCSACLVSALSLSSAISHNVLLPLFG